MKDISEIVEGWFDDERVEWYLRHVDGHRKYLGSWTYDESGSAGREDVKYVLQNLANEIGWKYVVEDMYDEE